MMWATMGDEAMRWGGLAGILAVVLIGVFFKKSAIRREFDEAYAAGQEAHERNPIVRYIAWVVIVVGVAGYIAFREYTRSQ